MKSRLGTWLVAMVLLGLQLALAERSLIQENPTVDEVVHLPAGVTYWQKGTFRLYHHNPPLIKLIAALPVVWAQPITEPLYQLESWTGREPSPTNFSQSFAFFNVDRYFELFQLARMVMPLFAVLGGLVVFLWSRALYGNLGGLLSLSLWVFCPNILAHGRLITTDVGSVSLGVAATWLFWLYLRRPGWGRAALAGFVLGLAQLSKFSMLLLYLVWPFLWLGRLALTCPRIELWKRASRGVAHGLLLVALSVLTIDVGYGFEGVGIPLGRFEFASSTMTHPVAGGIRTAPDTRNELYAMLWPFRENRFRGTILENLPAPLPEHYLLGFDEQKIEAEAIPLKFRRAWHVLLANDQARARRELESGDQTSAGYPVYLNGDLRRTGWWYYYLVTLLYKVPEGTWLLIGLSLVVLVVRSRSAEAWSDEICLAIIPVIVLFSMTVLTDINLGLRYVLAVVPYVYIAVGKVCPWAQSLWDSRRPVAGLSVASSLALTMTASLLIHPHYLSYFNWVSGGPDREPPRLIDSNLDWGQDLVGLREWCRQNAPGKRVGLAYFGQINPSMFRLRGDELNWFLPPPRPGTLVPMPRKPGVPEPRLVGPARSLTPGLYAVSSSIAHGLPWRFYDPSPIVPDAWAPTWNGAENAYSYFSQFQPIARIGHSILVYDLSAEDVSRVNSLLTPGASR